MTSKRHIAKFLMGISNDTNSVVFVDCKGKPNWKRNPTHAGRGEIVARRTVTDNITIGHEFTKALNGDGLTPEQAQRLSVLLAAASSDNFREGMAPPIDGWSEKEQAKYGIDKDGRTEQERAVEREEILGKTA